MKLTAIAVDYDGTIAERGRPDPIGHRSGPTGAFPRHEYAEAIAL